MDLILNCGYQTVGITCGPYNHGHLVERNLRNWKEITRPQLGTQVAISNVGYHADDLAHCRFVFIGRDSRLDPFANGILTGKELFRESLIDDDDPRRLRVVPCIEIASFQDSDTQRLKIAFIDREKVSGGLIALSDRPAFGLK